MKLEGLWQIGSICSNFLLITLKTNRYQPCPTRGSPRTWLGSNLLDWGSLPIDSGLRIGDTHLAALQASRYRMVAGFRCL
jgi:hypothetical protein